MALFQCLSVRVCVWVHMLVFMSACSCMCACACARACACACVCVRVHVRVRERKGRVYESKVKMPFWVCELSTNLDLVLSTPSSKTRFYGNSKNKPGVHTVKLNKFKRLSNLL